MLQFVLECSFLFQIFIEVKLTAEVKSGVPDLELAYALTVHKSQGSDFDIVFLILPRDATTLSKELLYTGLTRFRKKMVLLIERDTDVLERLRNERQFGDRPGVRTGVRQQS